ncbi:MAG: molybdopterin-dependent oxidoreductase [Solirubrobacterales bacterium]|nr:molybdopterin-dependent oxidoreductase [Solirubrobacterales bacterium]
MTSPSLIGRPLPRLEDAGILRGEARYLDDLEPEGALAVAFVRSPHAHARLGEIRAPRAADGLAAVITAADLADLVRPFPVQVPAGVSVVDRTHPVLAADEVGYVGQPVAAVVAGSRALAEDAAELVEVEYEPLEPVVELSDASERLVEFERTGGDVDGAFEAAEVVVARSYALPRMVTAPIETRGAIAAADTETGALTCGARRRTRTGRSRSSPTSSGATSRRSGSWSRRWAARSAARV